MKGITIFANKTDVYNWHELRLSCLLCGVFCVICVFCVSCLLSLSLPALLALRAVCVLTDVEVARSRALQFSTLVEVRVRIVGL